jgi:hypothetical protein
MNIKVYKITFISALFATLATSILVGSYGQIASGQTTPEQTAARSANMTASDFNGVTDNVITARQGILNNDSASAYGAINTAGSALFGLTQDAAGNNETLGKQLSKELKPVINNLDNARDALRDSNSTEAIRSLNTADLRLLEVIQELPPGEEDVEAETAG